MSKKEHVLDTAENLFNEYGYHAVGIDQIRDEAQISKTSIYRFFESKNKLIEAVLSRRHTRFEQEFAQLLTQVNTQQEKLNAIIDWHFTWFKAPHFKGCMFMHALAEFKTTEKAITQHAIKHKKWLKKIIMSTLDGEKEMNKIKAEEILTFIEGMIVRAEFEDITKNKKIYQAGIQALKNQI